MSDFNFEKIVSGMTTIDLANAIQIDARDTYSKLIDIFDLFSSVMGNDDQIDVVIHDLVTKYGNNFSVCLQDGDILNFVVDDGTDSLSLTYLLDGVQQTVPIVSSGMVVVSDIDEEILSTALGSYKWSLFQVYSSLAAQCQSCDVVAKLASLATKDEFNVSDVQLIVNSYKGELSSDVAGLISQITAAPGNMNQLSLINILKQLYSSIGSAVASDDTIEFDMTDYTVKSFNGTVVWDLIRTGVSMLGSVLLVAGGWVTKIIGAGILLANAIIPKVTEAAGISEHAVYNDGAKQYDFAKPLYQGSLASPYYSTTLYDQVSYYKILKLCYPYFNVYVWKGSDGILDYAVYANLLCNANWLDRRLNKFNTYTAPFSYTDTVSNATRTLAFKNYIDYDPENSTQLCLSVNEYLGFVASTSADFGMITDSSDAGLRVRLQKSLLGACFFVINANVLNLSQYIDAGREFYTTTVNASLSSSDVLNALVNDFIASDTLSSMTAALIWAIDHNLAITWTNLVNYFIPKLSSEFANMRSAIAILGTGAGAIGKASMVPGVTPVASFRSSFVLTPPNYEQGSALSALLVVLSAAAVIAIATVAAKVAISRHISGIMTTKYIDIQKDWENLKGMDPSDPDYSAARSSYLKKVRKYNLLAKFTGYSSLSAVQGWETGSSSSVGSSSPVEGIESVTNALNSVIGQDPESGRTVTLWDIFAIISGSTI